MTTSMCGECGEQNDPGVAFCVHCHAYLRWDDEAGDVAPEADASTEQATETRVLPRVEQLQSKPTTTPPAAGATESTGTTEGRFRVIAEPAAVSVSATGEPATVAVEIANTSSIVDGYQLEAPGSPEWLTIQADQLQLFPGTHQTHAIRLRVASPTLVPAQQTPVVLRIRSMVQPTAYADLPLTFTVPAVVTPVQLRPEPQLVRVRDQDTAHCAIVVDNSGSNQPLHLRFSGTDPEMAVRFAFEPQVLVVHPGQSGKVRVSMSAPGPVPGQEVSRAVTVTADDGRHRVQTTLTLQQATSAEDAPVKIEVVPSLIRLHDIDSADVQVILDNRHGRSPVRLWLGGSDPERAIHFSYTPAVADVPAGKVMTVDLRLDALPLEPGQEQTRTFTVTAGDGRSTVQAQASVVQATSRAAIETLTVSLNPSVLNLAGRRHGSLTAVLDNRAGTQPANVTLHGDDPRNALRFDFSPTAVTIGPGGSATARVGVRAPRPQSGGEVNLPFEVLASDGRSEVRTSGSVIQSVADRRPLFRVLFTLLGGLMIIFGTLQPLRTGDPTRAVDLNVGVLGDVFGFNGDLAGFERLLTVGLVIIALGVLVMVGLSGTTGRLTRRAAVLCLLVVLAVLVAIAFIGFSPVPGSGAVLIILGCIIAYIGGLLIRR